MQFSNIVLVTTRKFTLVLLMVGFVSQSHAKIWVAVDDDNGVGHLAWNFSQVVQNPVNPRIEVIYEMYGPENDFPMALVHTSNDIHTEYNHALTVSPSFQGWGWDEHYFIINFCYDSQTNGDTCQQFQTYATTSVGEVPTDAENAQFDEWVVMTSTNNILNASWDFTNHPDYTSQSRVSLYYSGQALVSNSSAATYTHTENLANLVSSYSFLRFTVKFCATPSNCTSFETYVPRVSIPDVINKQIVRGDGKLTFKWDFAGNQAIPVSIVVDRPNSGIHDKIILENSEKEFTYNLGDFGQYLIYVNGASGPPLYQSKYTGITFTHNYAPAVLKKIRYVHTDILGTPVAETKH